MMGRSLQQGRNLKVMQDYKSQTGDTTDNLPLAVVINSGGVRC